MSSYFFFFEGGGKLIRNLNQIFKEIRENGGTMSLQQIFSNSEESVLGGIIEVPKKTVGRLQAARNNVPADSPEQYYK